MNRAVHRLHRGVREERQLVVRFELVAVAQRLVRIAGLLGDEAGLLACFLDLAPHLRGVDMPVRARIPGDIERVETALRSPHMIADNGHHVVEHDNLTDARNFLRRAVVDMADLAPNAGDAAMVANLRPGSITSMP